MVDLYGAVNYTEGSSASNYGFTNEYQSQGKIYLRARHYIPSLGRFLTRDTWDGDANNPLSFNRWNYVEGNPVNYIDPSGFMTSPGVRLFRYRPLSIMPPMAPINSTLEYVVSLLGSNIYDCESSFANALGLIAISAKEKIESEYGVILTSEGKDGEIISTSNWALPDLSTLELAMRKIAFRLQGSLRDSSRCHNISCVQVVSGKVLFRGFFGGLELRRGPKDTQYVPNEGKIWGIVESGNLIRLYGPKENWGYGKAIERTRGIYLIQHEFGHVLDKRMNGQLTNKLSISSKGGTELSKIISKIIEEETKEGEHPNKWGPFSGLGVNMRSAVRYAIKEKETGKIIGYVPAYGEFFADAFASWVNKSFVYSNSSDSDQQNGKVWEDFINPLMGELVGDFVWEY